MKYICFLVILISYALPVPGQVSELEFEALKAIYNATSGENWKNRDGWENINSTASNEDVTTAWKGIINIVDGHIIDLDMRDNNLQGYLPPQIGDLVWIKYLVFDQNDIQGTIPPEIANLSELAYLGAAQTGLNGPLPQSLSTLKKLTNIHFNYAPLNCEFPNEILSELPNLERIDLYNCGLTGALGDIFDSIPKLSGFDISLNSLSGTLPPSLSRLKQIASIHLAYNQFTGEIPSLDSCSTIYYLTLNDNQFEGEIPSTYNNFPSLQYLHLSKNKLSGPIPEGLFTEIFKRLWVDWNYFTFEGLEPVYDEMITIQHQYQTYHLFPLEQDMILINEGETLDLNAADLSTYGLGGNNNRYKWFLNNVEVFSSNDPNYHLDAATSAQAGVYRFEVRNLVIQDLVIKSDNILVSVLVPGNHAPTDISLNKMDVTENYVGYLGQLSASDPDESDTHVFDLVDGSGTEDRDNVYFSIFGNQLHLIAKPDFETKPELQILVSANDLKGGIIIIPLVLQVNDLDEPPYFSGQLTNNTIDETSSNGTTVLPLLAYDPEGKPVSFLIEKGNENGAFGILANKLIVADNTQLDYDLKSQYIMDISASDSTLTTSITLFIHLSKINKIPTIEDVSFAIDENSPSETYLGDIVATDPEGGIVTISILAGNKNHAFKLVGNSLLVNNSDALDFDSDPQFSLLMNASDGISNVQGTCTVYLHNLVDELGNDILAFSVPGLVEPPVIDPDIQSVNALVSGVDISAIPVTFTLSKGASSDPFSGAVLNLLTPVSVIVTSETGVDKLWTLKLSYPVASEELDRNKNFIYPNPVWDKLWLEGITEPSVIRIINASGESVEMKPQGPGYSPLDVAGLSPGVYFILIETPVKTIKRFIKM